MPTVTGTLKFFAPVKEGARAALTGEWSDGEKKQYVSWAEAQPLRDAGVVFQGDKTWDDGNPKWEVRGKPLVTLNQRWEGTGREKQCFTVVVLGNGALPESAAPVASQPTSPPKPSSAYRSVKDVAAHFAYCLRQAREIVWVKNDTVTADALYKTAYTIYSDADPDDTPDTL